MCFLAKKFGRRPPERAVAGIQLHGPLAAVGVPAVAVFIRPSLDGVFEILYPIVIGLIVFLPLLPVLFGDTAGIPDIIGAQIFGHVPFEFFLIN